MGRCMCPSRSRPPPLAPVAPAFPAWSRPIPPVWAPHGLFLHDSRPGLILASAVFIKGGLWGEAYSDAKVPPGTVLTLGRYVYSHLST